MKNTGVVRKIDELGRIVLPSSMRSHLDIKAGDPLEMLIEGNRVVVQKYEPACVFCNGGEEVILFGGKRVCRACVEKLKAEL